MNIEKKAKMRLQGTTWKKQLPLSNIHFNNGKCPHSNELKRFSTISDMSHTSKVLWRQAQTITLNMLQGYQQLVSCAYESVTFGHLYLYTCGIADWSPTAYYMD